MRKTILQGYNSMFELLDAIYFRTYSDDLGGILGSMQTDEEGVPMDKAMMDDWIESVQKTTNNVDLTNEEIYNAMIDFLEGTAKRNSSSDLQELASDLQAKKTGSKFFTNIDSEWQKAIEKASGSNTDSRTNDD